MLAYGRGSALHFFLLFVVLVLEVMNYLPAGGKNNIDLVRNPGPGSV
jgi:hypothetical protein